MSTVFYLLLLLAAYCECRQNYTISGPVWRNKIQSCNSWGEYQQTYTFVLPNLRELGLEFKDLDSLTTVIARFEGMTIETKAVKNADVKQLWLNEYSSSNNKKQYSGRVGYSASIGWGSQGVVVRLTLKISSDGSVQLDNYVYAASWGSASCATTKADVHHLEIIN